MSEQSVLLGEVERAEKAKSILDSELVAEAIDKLRKTVVSEFLDTKSVDTDKLQMLALKRDVVEQFVNHFRQIIQTGKLASVQLSQSQGRKQK